MHEWLHLLKTAYVILNLPSRNTHFTKLVSLKRLDCHLDCNSCAQERRCKFETAFVCTHTHEILWKIMFLLNFFNVNIFSQLIFCI